jgi:hypothetical protein
VAYLGAGQPAQGELLLDEAAKLDPTYQQGAIDLARGRFRLARGDAQGAIAPLERFVSVREGSVEGRVLLARALDEAGRDADAALVRDAAWAEYVGAPGFQRRRERLWAWRARPSRPLTYGLVLAAVLAALALGITRAQGPGMVEPTGAGWAADEE